MLDFRYHALSLVAVFLALAIGIVLGVTIGDSLLSEAEQGVRNSLRSDVVEAREQAEEARSAVAARDGFIERVEPGLVRGRLTGRRVAIVSWGPLPAEVEEGVREAVRAGGGRIDSVSQFVAPLTDLGDAIGASQFDAVRRDERSLLSLGRRLGRSVLSGGALPRDLRGLEDDRFRGRYLGSDSVVYFRAPEPLDPDEHAQEREGDGARALHDGLLEAFADGATELVGVEASDTEPSQVGFYRGRDLTSVDSVDVPGGRVALVFALTGADGTFGFKSSARDPIPDSGQLGF